MAMPMLTQAIDVVGNLVNNSVWKKTFC